MCNIAGCQERTHLIMPCANCHERYCGRHVRLRMRNLHIIALCIPCFNDQARPDVTEVDNPEERVVFD
jgi:hypothetical protein